MCLSAVFEGILLLQLRIRLVRRRLRRAAGHTIERGTTYNREDGELRRVFALVY